MKVGREIGSVFVITLNFERAMSFVGSSIDERVRINAIFEGGEGRSRSAVAESGAVDILFFEDDGAGRKSDNAVGVYLKIIGSRPEAVDTGEEIGAITVSQHPVIDTRREVIADLDRQNGFFGRAGTGRRRNGRTVGGGVARRISVVIDC